MSSSLYRVVHVYQGSSGAETTALYRDLEAGGPGGVIAVNLFRAQKCSARAKVYRGGNGQSSYRDLAYGRKQWAIDNLCTALLAHAEAINLVWGWREDPGQPFHKWVLYVELPTGQVSFHTARRGEGLDFARSWDGQRDVSPDRIIRYVAGVLDRAALLRA